MPSFVVMASWNSPSPLHRDDAHALDQYRRPRRAVTHSSREAAHSYINFHQFFRTTMFSHVLHHDVQRGTFHLRAPISGSLLSIACAFSTMRYERQKMV
jgi:hypothetical protein